MPTYEYLCKSCGERLEVQQRFTDEALTECPLCEGPLRKVFGNVGIAFKGSGFYKTDSRSSRKSGAGAKSESKSETKTETKTESKKDSGSGKSEAKSA